MRLAAALAIPVLASCAPAPPAYDPPRDSEAGPAFKRAMKSDWVDQPLEIGEPPATTNAMNYQKSVEWNENNSDNKNAPRVYGAYQKLNIDTCEWRAFRARKLPDRVRVRVTAPPEAAYFCQYTAHYRINPPHGRPEFAKGEGWFYRDDYRFNYAGRFAHPY